jgi:hypothetical protein
MSLPDSSYETTRILPKLDKQSTEQRYKWSKAFWIFWTCAKLLAVAVQILEVLFAHNDEKWIYTIVVRTHNKCVPVLGVFPVKQSVHHKSHIEKILALATTGFAPHNNNIEKGGVAHKISLTRAGRMQKAKKDSYKRFYQEDGTYHYPKIPENKLRMKGEMYFESMEITGSNEGTATDPKFSLLKHWKETELPALDVTAQKIQSNNGKQVIVRYQWDSATPHVNSILTEFLQKEFDRRGWILVPQPANSPLTNTKDAALFPSLSKSVTTEQGLMHGSYVLQGEQLWDIVKLAWERMGLDTIARAYAGHHQIVNAIFKCKGGDDFTRQHKGLHCGIQKMFVPYYDRENQVEPSGVEVIESLGEIEIDGDGLKYAKPDVSGLDFAEYLTLQELDILMEYMPTECPEWASYAAAATRKLFEEG